MTEPTPPTEEEEQAARTICREILKSDPEANYRDVRREARDRGAKVTRRVFSAVLQELFPDRKQARDDYDSRPHGGFRPDGGDRSDDGGHRHPGGGFRRDGSEPRRPQGRPAFDNPHVAPRRPQGPPRPPQEDRGGGPGRAGEARGRWDELWKSNSPVDDSPPPSEMVDLFTGNRSAPPASRPPENAPIRANAVEFMAGHLRDNPEASYKEVRELAEDNGYTVSAAAFGRAQVIAGILERDEEETKPVIVLTPPPVATPVAAPAAPAPPVAKERSVRKGDEVFQEGDPLYHLQEFVKHFAESSEKRGDLRSALQEMLKVVQAALNAPK